MAIGDWVRRLLHDDTSAEKQQKAQEDYTWDWSWPPGVATLASLPRSEEYRPEFVAMVAGLVMDMVRNHGAASIENAQQVFPPPKPPSRADELLHGFLDVATSLHQGMPKTRPKSPDGYTKYFATIPQTPLVVKSLADPDLANRLFAWQRVAGCNPMSLRRWDVLPDDFDVTEAHWEAAKLAGSLSGALATGHVFGVDFTMLHGVPCTKYLGRQKYLTGARGLFAAAADRQLHPVAIQLTPGGRIFTPRDGTAWAMAQYCLTVADANVHETQEHLGKTHMIMEAVGIASRRQLPEKHPLRLLLDPHLIGTFAVNNSAKTSLIAPGGVIDKVFAARIDLAAGLVRDAVEGFSLQHRSPILELRGRGLDDVTVLDFPYRDDLMPVYTATERFVQGYVLLYYADDQAVVDDKSLQAWVAEAASPVGGALRNVKPVETVQGLVVWMTNLLHLASTQHAAVNFPQFPFYAWGATAAGACWGPGPHHVEASEAALLDLMPAMDCIFLQADTVYQLAGVHYTRLGDYSFDDIAADALTQTFQSELAAAEQQQIAADQSRLLTYPFLRPSTVPASINI